MAQSRAMSGPWRARAAVLVLIGSLAVHQGRYLAFSRPDDHAHAYLEWLVPALTALTFVLLAEFAARLALTRPEPPTLPSRARLWLLATVALLAIFGAQETIEGVAAHGAWPSPLELAADGGWTAAPLALAVGGLVVLLLAGAASIAARVARRREPRHRAPRSAARPHLPLLAPPASVLARRLAGRAPPQLR